MKNLLDRILPNYQPHYEMQGGHSSKPVWGDAKWGRSVLVSSAALWKLDNFGALLEHMRAVAWLTRSDYMGALLRPHSTALRWLSPESYADVLGAAREAGRQLVSSGVMRDETLRVVSRELMPLDEYVGRL